MPISCAAPWPSYLSSIPPNRVSQENIPVRRGKGHVEALTRGGRAVLGEISQNLQANTRRNNAKAGKQQQASSRHSQVQCLVLSSALWTEKSSLDC